ncbi:MAG: PAS domain S-box protein, partial [Cyanobacteria bacterium P01_F01_bin.3]
NSQFLAAVVQSSKDAILTHTLDHRITSWNPAATHLFGYTETEAIGQPISLLVPPHQLKEEEQIVQSVQNPNPIDHFETIYLCKDGHPLEVSVTISPLKDDSGQVAGVSRIVRDITHSKMAEAELQKLSLVASKTDNFVVITNAQGQIEWVNESFHRVTGYALDEVIGKKPGSFLQGNETDPDTVDQIRDALAHQQSFSGEILNYRKDGSPYWLSLQINPVFDVDGKLTHFIALENDITEYKQLEMNLISEVTHRQMALEELNLLNQQLAISNRELQDFAYVSSHDLQEPLRKIQAFGDRLQSTCQGSLNAKGQDYLNRMLNAAGRAQVLINDLLSFSRVTTKANPFVSIDLSKILEEVLSDLEIRIEETNALIEVDSLPTIEADPLQIRQLFQNLISNALKFRQEGVAPIIQIRSHRYSQQNEDWCTIQVIDNGIGFEQKYAERIFQIFQRLHGRGVYEGTGIGLAICRKITERHGGILAATSEPGQGTTFSFSLPIKQNKPTISSSVSVKRLPT